MNNLLKLIRQQLINIIEDIDCGNSDLPEDQCLKTLEYLTTLTNKNEKLSKYQACKYIGKSRAQFDNYVRDGLIPKGRKQQGFKEIF